MVGNSLNISCFHNRLSNSCEFSDLVVWSFNLICFSDALGSVFIASEFNSNLLVITQQSQTSWHAGNWISANNVSLGFCVGNLIKMICPLFISDSRSSISCHSDSWENFSSSNINVRNDGQSSSKTDTSDMKGGNFSLFTHFS